MLQLARVDDYEVWLSRVDRPFAFLAPFSGAAFALMLVVADTAVTPEERTAVSGEIVRQGCRYAVCAGFDCGRWDDSIDWACIDTNPDASPSDDRFVMTTWHENDSLDDVAEYFRRNTMFEDFMPRQFLVLLLGGDSDAEDRVRAAVMGVFS